ncbi:MAG: hypothetical protein NTW25_11825 [Candidatus Kapabacteria bacterium]|nr:hypothetical protein [Candidatus Kapabacteria bacterium]
MKEAEFIKLTQRVIQPNESDLKKAEKILLGLQKSEDLRSQINIELKNIKFNRTKHIEADFAEAYAAIKLGLTLVKNNTPGFDALDNDHKKYQIKKVTLGENNKISSYPKVSLDTFDYLVVVILKKFKVNNLFKISHADLINPNNGMMGKRKANQLTLSNEIYNLLQKKFQVIQ